MTKKNNNLRLMASFTFLLIYLFSSCQKSELPESVNSIDLNYKIVDGLSNVGTTASTSILAYYDFNTTLGSWYERSLSNSWSADLSTAPARAGKAALRFELRSTDSKLGYRTELGQKPGTEKEGWYGFSNYFPGDFVKDPMGETIAQFHSHPDLAKGESWRGPVFALFIEKDVYYLDLRNDANAVTTGVLPVTRIELGPVTKDVWNDWVIHAKWAWDNTGVLEIWRDKKLILSRKNLPNCYNDATTPYLKIGLSKWGWGQKVTPGIDKRVYYIDELTIGNGSSSFASVDPARFGTEGKVVLPIAPITAPIGDKMEYFDFDTNLGPWYEKSLPAAWSAFLHPSPSRKGKSSLRFELRRTDSKFGYRTEIGQEPDTEKEKWFGFSNYFPAQYIKDPLGECIVQLQAHPDVKSGESWRSPPVALMIVNDRFVLDLRSDANAITRSEPKLTRIDLGPVKKEVWNDWVIHAKWAWDNTGILEVWKDNELIISRKNTPNCYNDLTYPYFKMGIYKWEWASRSTPSVQKRVYFADEVTIATGSSEYSKVYPGR